MKTQALKQRWHHERRIYVWTTYRIGGECPHYLGWSLGHHSCIPGFPIRLLVQYFSWRIYKTNKIISPGVQGPHLFALAFFYYHNTQKRKFMIKFANVYIHRLVFSKNLRSGGRKLPRFFLLSYAKTQNSSSSSWTQKITRQNAKILSLSPREGVIANNHIGS